MKRLLLVLLPISLFVFSCEDIEEQKTKTEFNKTFGGSNYDSGRSIQQTNDGGYIVTGGSNSYGGEDSDVWLIKTDTQGNKLWDKTFGGSNYDFGNSVQQTTNGGFIITGITSSFGSGNYDVWLIKTGSQGNEEWNKTFGGSGNDKGYSVIQTMEDGFILLGSTESDSSGNQDVWLIKTDSQGNEEWKKIYDGNTGDKGYSVQQTTDGGYIITGITSFFGGSDVWLIKTDSEGNEEWNQIFGGSEDDYSQSVQQTTDGGCIITGLTSSFGSGNFDVWLIKTDSQGNEEWNQTFGGSEDDYGRSVEQTNDGGYIITGETISYGSGGFDIWLIKTDSQGGEEWNKTFGGSGYEEGYSVQQTTDDGYIITGSTDSYGNGSSDVWLIKTDSEGNTEPYGD